ncbi:MAG: hypothetical protein Q7V57_01255 [Actinomycetota bacterium]|nr:hypothetical protein [Actinomycetota bacterium]
MSITQVTTYAGWLAGLAIAALVATGWRRSVHASAELERSRGQQAVHEAIELSEEHAPLDAPVPLLQKVWSAVAGFGLAVWVGAATATVIAFGMAYLVVTLTNMLKK